MVKTKLIHTIANHILCEAREEGYMLGRTKLVKLFYLIDIDRIRRSGELLTGARWRYHHYGPYDETLAAAIQQTPGIVFREKEEIDGGREFIGYDVEQRLPDYGQLRPALRAAVERVYKEWIGADLQTLLSYVYFETEPMQNAQKGQYLDFSKVRPARQMADREEVPDYDSLIPEEGRIRLRALLKRSKAGVWRRPLSSIQGELLLEALAAMDAEDGTKLPEGSVSVDEDLRRKLSDQTGY